MKKVGFIFVFLALLLYLLFETNVGMILRLGNLGLLVQYMKSLGWLAYLISFGAIILQTFFPFIPFIILAGANAFVFGLMKGFFVSWLFAVIGAVLAFYFSRYLAYDFAKKQTEKYPVLRKFENQVKTNGFMIFLLGRLIPILPSSIVNFFGGISSIRIRDFFWSTFLGKIPIVFLETMVGHDAVYFKQHPKRLVILVVIFILLMYIGLVINKQLTNKKIIRN